MIDNEAASDEESPVPLDLVEQSLAARQPDESQASSVGPWPYLENPGSGSSQPVGGAEQPRIDTVVATVT